MSKYNIKLRASLREVFDDNCYWCGFTMVFPEKGQPCFDMPNMATIEHHHAKQKGRRNEFMFLRLAHKRCNK